MQKPLNAVVLSTALFIIPTIASAHVGLAGPNFANTSNVFTFTVGHGCEGADTYKVELTLPAGLSSIRSIAGQFGNGVITRDEAGVATKVTWEKPATALLPGDDQYYTVQIRARTPNTPFAVMSFPVTQYCRTAEGEERSSAWDSQDATSDHPAPKAVLLPARRAGWNKYVVAEALADLSAFSDAQIVWAGDAAYSPNADIAALIATEPGVTTLASVPAGATLWVKY